MKKTIFFLLVPILANIFWGCNSTTDNSDLSKDKAGTKSSRLNWLASWHGREGKEQLAKHVAREFELLNQEVSVNMQFAEEVYKTDLYRDQITDTILKMVRTAKTYWDLIYLTSTVYKRVADSLNDPFWGKKHLVDLSGYDWFQQSHKSFILDDPMYKNAYGGIFPAPVIEGIYSSLWYNADVAKKIGIEVKHKDMTFDDLRGYLQQAAEYNKTASEKATLMVNDRKSSLANDLLFSFAISALGDFDTSNPNFDKSLLAFKNSLEALEALSKFHPLESYSKVGPDQDPLLEGKVLFASCASYVINYWLGIDKKKFYRLVPAELPILNKPGKYYKGLYQSVFGVFKNSPNVDHAINLLKFWSSNDIAERWNSGTKNPTGLKSYIDASEIGQDDIEQFNDYLIKKYGSNIGLPGISEVLFGFKNRTIAINAVDVLNGKKSANEFYNEIVSKLKR